MKVLIDIDIKSAIDTSRDINPINNERATYFQVAPADEWEGWLIPLYPKELWYKMVENKRQRGGDLPNRIYAKIKSVEILEE
jgi:hypothetical protein